MNLKKWVEDRQLNGDDGSGYCDYCKEESNKEMCDHCAEADEAGVLNDYLSGKVKCPACERESER